jgi:transcription initiation factor TFIIH subunit 2
VQLDKVSKETIGEPSIQNALELAQQTLMHTPNHVSREVILLFGSLSSCDPGNLEETVVGLVNDFIRVSIIGLCAQLRICEWIAQVTNGTYRVILNEAHYKELLHAHVPPPPLTLEKKNQMIQMGFPTGKEFYRPTLCACHQKIIFKGFQCPKCASIVCEIPRDCPICSLTLVSSPSLARSYHHLFPVPVYQEKKENGTCFACRESIDIFFQCPRCMKDFCNDCDLYIHDSLHNCPGCTS